MEIIREDGIDWFLLENGHDSVKGIAIVKKGFKARLHSHQEEEGYQFLYGTGKLLLETQTIEIESPQFIMIPSNAVHAMTPITDFVILLFTFQKGPFENIIYHYRDEYLN